MCAYARGKFININSVYFSLSEDNPKRFNYISDWGRWLRDNHQNKKAVWLVIQKKLSQKTGIRYEEAVMEAVAYGWIDGRMKRLNDEEFIQRFSPRRRNSNWSKSNIERANLLISEGRMTPAGFKAIENAKKSGRWDFQNSVSRKFSETPADLVEALKMNKPAYENFKDFPPYARFMYIHWINEAKRKETRERRIFTVVYRSENNLKPGIDMRVVKKK